MRGFLFQDVLQRFKKYWRTVFLGAVLVVLTLFYTQTWVPSGLVSWRHDLSDMQTRWLAGQTQGQPQHVVIIDIDEASLDVLGPWPWPRPLLARLLETLFSHYHVQSASLDMVFPEAARPVEDQALVKVLKAWPITVAQVLSVDQRNAALMVGELRSGPAALWQSDPKIHAQAPIAQGYIGNHLSLGALPCVGHISPEVDRDGTIRRVAPWISFQTKAYPSLVLSQWACSPDGQVYLAKHPSLTYPANWSVPYRYLPKQYVAISAYQILSGAAPMTLLEGRHALVGASALGLVDRVATPVQADLPGVYVHAELLEALYSPQVLMGADWSYLSYGAALCMAIALWWSFSRASVRKTLGLWIIFAAATFVLGLVTQAWSLRFDWILVWVVLLVFLMIQAPIEWALAASRTRMMERRLRRYLPPALASQVAQSDEGALIFAPKRVAITTLFVDLDAYTHLSETQSPEDLAAITQEVMEVLTHAVYHHGGTLDKYMGDALMAFWGAPVDHPEPVDAAIDCLQTMWEHMPRLNAQLQARWPGLPPMAIHAGLNTGDAVVGEMGSSWRQVYTAMGDAVNIAARLMDEAKQSPYGVMIGERSALGVRRHTLRDVGSYVLRGRQEAMRVYTMAFAVNEATSSINDGGSSR